MFIGTHIGESTDVFSDVFVDITGEKSRDMCVDMRVDMRVDMCGDMYVDMCGDMGVDIIVDMCVGLESGVPRELLWAERFFFATPEHADGDCRCGDTHPRMRPPPKNLLAPPLGDPS